MSIHDLPSVNSFREEQHEGTKNVSINWYDDEGNQPQHEKISFYLRPIQNVNPSNVIDLTDVHRLLTSSQYKEVTKQFRSIYKEAEKKVFKANNFDYVTFNGVFSTRADDKLMKASGLFVIDIDNLGPNLDDVRNRVISDPILRPKLVFVSPSNDGLKIVVGIDRTLIAFEKKSKIMEFIWDPVNAYFKQKYSDLITPNANDDYIDSSGKDISRACFLCHDPDAWINDDAQRILDQAFIDTFQPVRKKETHYNGKTETKIINVNPATSIQDLASRHLFASENHHPEIRSFVGACKSVSIPKEHTLSYLIEHASISAESAHQDPATLTQLVEDIYERYGTDSADVTYLTPNSFGYKFLFFKYSRELKRYTVTSLFYDDVRTILHNAGFAKRTIGKDYILVQQTGGIIKEVTSEIMKNHLTSIIDAIKESFHFSYQGQLYHIPPETIRETYFRNSHNIFNDQWLEQLQINNTPILKDTEKEMFFCFKNIFVTVTADEIITKTWDEISGFCVWEDQIIQRNYEYVEDTTDSHYYRFIKNVTDNDDDRFSTMVSGLGYLLHHHFRESEGQAVVFYDQTITDTRTPQGGSGKGLIVNSVKQVRTVSKIDGKHLDSANRFRWEQITPSTQVAWLDDVRTDFDFSMLHSNLTDGWTIERKFLSQFLISPKDSPKTVICSNSIIKGGGSTNKRRQFIIELSDYYSKQIINGNEKPIEDTHGCIFFSDEYWQQDEWNKFYSFMMNCASYYLSNGLIPFKGINVEYNRLRQSTDEDFASWVMEQGFEQYKQYDTKKYFNEYVGIYYGDNYKIGQRTFTNWMRSFAAYCGWNFETKQSNGTSYFIF